MRRLINHVKHHAKRHGKAVHKHIREHHQKYIFGAISGALVYKTLALILTTAVINPMGITFASGTVETEYTGTVMSGDFFVNNDDSSTTGLDVTINNNIQGATHMRFGNTESDRNIAAWDVYSNTVNRVLDDNGTGEKIVYAQFSGNNASGENIILDLQDSIEYILESTGSQQNTGETNTGVVNSGFIEDITPDSISFDDVVGADLTTEYYSNTVTIIGINTGADISISNNDGMYQINSQAWTDSGSIIYSGDTVKLKMFSDDNYDIQKTLTLYIGDTETDWNITTTGETQSNTGTNTTNTGTNNTGTVNTGTTSNSNGICDSQDISFINPLSGTIINGEFNINREYNNTDCNDDQFTVKLRDANTQYIELGTVNISNQTSTGSTGGVLFDSSLLYSGFYNITGLDLFGNIEVIYTGYYLGVNTKYYSGYKLAILNIAGETMYEGDYFTIDNLNPELSNISLDITNETNGYVGLNGTINLSFDSSEGLSGVQVTILGTYAVLASHTNNTYMYTIDLSPSNTAGNIIYNIEFEDLAGNTGYAEGNSNIYFDNSAPFINNLEFNHSSSIVSLVLSTDENSKVDFAYNISGSNIGGTFESTYTLSHNHIFTGIQSDVIYNYTLSVYDTVDNTIYIGGYFIISGSNIIYDYEVISSDDMIVDTGFQNPQDDTTQSTGDVVSTGATVSTSPANTFRTEIEKFKACKESLTNTRILEIPVRKYKARIEMPELEKNYVRKLVSAFSIVLFDRIAKGGLNEQEINDITKEFNNFLVILKLVRDEDNSCEQNLSNYYMSKFRDSLIEYNLVE